MNTKKFLITAVVVFVVGQVFGFVIHGVILGPEYGQFPNLLRTQEQAEQHLHFMIIGSLVASLAFVWIYAHGVEPKSWVGQGVRYGLAVWMLSSVPFFLTYYALQPWSGILVAKQIALEGVSIVLLGILAAALYRKP